jgi:hypothetical protein
MVLWACFGFSGRLIVDVLRDFVGWVVGLIFQRIGFVKICERESGGIRM